MPLETNVTDTRPRLTRVVVAYDGSAPARAALEIGLDEAVDRGVPVHLVTAVDPGPAVDGSVPLLLATAQRAAQEAAQQASGVLGEDRVSHAVEVGAAAAVVLAACRPEDLLVLGSHGHRPVARMLLGSTSTTVATHAVCPVMIVRGVRPRPDAYVLVGVDGSATSTRALRLGADEADRHQVALRAVIAVPPVVDAYGFVSGPDEPRLVEAQVVLAESVAGLRQDYPDLVVEPLVVQTHPVEALMRHARVARLVVVGSRGRGGIASMLLGSVSREMLLRAPCAVALARPGPEEAAPTASARMNLVPV